MELSNHYLSFVTERIESLKQRLENQDLSGLEREFIEGKIAYLKRLTDLPLLITITNMSNQELESIRNKYGNNNEDPKKFLIQLFELEKLDTLVKQPKHVTLEYLKEAIINDFHTMEALIELQNRNFEYERKKQALYGVGLNGNISYLQLSHDEKELGRHTEQIEGAILESSQDFDLETLKELRNYQTNRQKPLSIDFILKHQEKVEQNPKLRRVAKRLTRKGILGKIDKILPFRKKREQQFLDAVLENYRNSNSLAVLGIANQDVTTMNDHQIRSLIKRIKKQITYHRNKINEAQIRITTSKKLIFQKIKEYEVLQEQDKKRFMELLSTKTNYLPRMFQDQIWNEPNLKESLIRLACYIEEKSLIEELQTPMQNKFEILTQVSTERPKTYSKKAA